VLISVRWKLATAAAVLVGLSACAESVPVQADPEEIETAVEKANEEASQAKHSGNMASRP
jgi:hypothetical protein